MTQTGESQHPYNNVRATFLQMPGHLVWLFEENIAWQVEPVPQPFQNQGAKWMDWITVQPEQEPEQLTEGGLGWGRLTGC